MKLIYRIEDALGKGMYCGTDCPVKYMMQEERHPPPYQDIRLRDIWETLYEQSRQRDFQFGFSSLDQLRSWIYREEWRDALNAAGFKVYVYAAKEYYLGDTQAIMIKPALPVGHIVLTALAGNVADEWFQSLEEEYNAPERKDSNQAPNPARKYWQDYMESAAAPEHGPVSVGP